MSDPWNDFGGSDATATEEGPWSEFSPANTDFKDLSAGQVPVIKPPTMPGDMPSTAAGGTVGVGRLPNWPEVKEAGQTMVQAPMNALGVTVAGVTRTARDLVSPTTWLPDDQKPQAPFVLPFGEGEIRPRTPKEMTAAEPLQAGKPLYEPEPGSPTAEGNELARLLSRWSTPEAIAVLPASKNPIAGALLLTTMIPGILGQVKDAISGGGSDQEKRDRVNDLVALAALTVAHRAAPGIKESVSGKIPKSQQAADLAEMLDRAEFQPVDKPWMAYAQAGQRSVAPPTMTADDLTKAPEAPAPVAPPPGEPVPEPAPRPQAAPVVPKAVETPAAPETPAVAPVEDQTAPKPSEPAPSPEPVGKGEKTGETLAHKWDRLYASEHSDLMDAQRRMEEARQYQDSDAEKNAKQERDDILQRLDQFDQLSRKGRFDQTPPKDLNEATIQALRDNPKLTLEQAATEGRSALDVQHENDAYDAVLDAGGSKKQANAAANKVRDARMRGFIPRKEGNIPEPSINITEQGGDIPKSEQISTAPRSNIPQPSPAVENAVGKVEQQVKKLEDRSDYLRDLRDAQPKDSSRWTKADRQYRTAFKRWKEAAEKAQSEQPTPTAPAPKMEGPGSPSRAQGPDTAAGGFQDQSGRDIYGIAARVRAQRAKAGQVAPVESGEGVSPKESVEWGRELLASGVDPEAALSAFEKDPAKKIAFDLTAVTRAHGEALAKAAVDVESKFGTDSVPYRTAKKALDDWDARTKRMDTQWHKIGQAMQGHIDIDTGTFTGIERAYKAITGEDLNPAQVKTAKKIAKKVSDADKAAQATKAPLDAAIDAINKPVEPHIRRLADKIIAAMDKQADAALKRIKARQAEGRMFSGGDPEDIQDLVIYGAAKITKGVVEFGAWSAEMVKDIGEGIKPHLKRVFDSAKKYEDEQTTTLAGGKPMREKVREATKPTAKAPVSLEDQRRVFGGFKEGGTMTPDQVKTLWQRAKVYIDQDLANTDPSAKMGLAEIVHKVAIDLGIPAKDVLAGLNQSRNVRRIADDVWQKQRQARLLKASAKRWIENAQETWLSKLLPNAARMAFSAKTFGHGTVALGTHAPLTAATHPIIFANNFGKMYKLVLSPDYYEMQQFLLSRRKNYIPAQRAGLVNDMSKMEDFNDPRLAMHFPGMAAWFKKTFPKIGAVAGAGTRGYSVLKILRQDLFDHEWDKLPDSMKFDETGQVSPVGQKVAAAIADSVNHITGVVKAKTPSAANYALFAPKLELSRLSVIAGDPGRAVNSLLHLGNMTPAEKWFASNQFKQVAKIFAVSQGLLLANQQLNNLFGDKKKLNGVPESLGGAGYNPMASDFMKFRVAGMNVAWASPFLTMTRLPLRLVQIGMSDGGKSKFLIYPDESMYKTIGSYLRTQSSPFLQPIMSLAMKADYQNRPLPQIPFYGPPPPMPKRLAAEGIEPYTWGEFGSDVVLPIPFQEGAKEVFHYGLGATPEQQQALLKGFIISAIMGATGGRISEDWNKPQ